ncbi:hypothetical protein ATANTOWER_018915 [Ataeniobius toweri]|uniref:Uncharacterized protein n=1 Tax=Ataeniobius toweri TaxID=208326 RepID=A0ABU7B7E9_9TELE|nr:hypothetical protein [Ataeniobius toweri]
MSAVAPSAIFLRFNYKISAQESTTHVSDKIILKQKCAAYLKQNSVQVSLQLLGAGLRSFSHQVCLLHQRISAAPALLQQVDRSNSAKTRHTSCRGFQNKPLLRRGS